jgi:hypothetical protein
MCSMVQNMCSMVQHMCNVKNEFCLFFILYFMSIGFYLNKYRIYSCDLRLCIEVGRQLTEKHIIEEMI